MADLKDITNFPVKWGGPFDSDKIESELKKHFEERVKEHVEGKSENIRIIDTGLISRNTIDLDRDGSPDVFVATGFISARRSDLQNIKYLHGFFSIFVDKAGRVFFSASPDHQWNPQFLFESNMHVSGKADLRGLDKKSTEEAREIASAVLKYSMDYLLYAPINNPELLSGNPAFSFTPPPLCQTALVNLLSATLNPWELLSYFLLVKPFPKECR